jgi:hypothetical protein
MVISTKDSGFKDRSKDLEYIIKRAQSQCIKVNGNKIKKMVKEF